MKHIMPSFSKPGKQMHRDMYLVSVPPPKKWESRIDIKYPNRKLYRNQTSTFSTAARLSHKDKIEPGPLKYKPDFKIIKKRSPSYTIRKAQSKEQIKQIEFFLCDKNPIVKISNTKSYNDTNRSQSMMEDRKTELSKSKIFTQSDVLYGELQLEKQANAKPVHNGYVQMAKKSKRFKDNSFRHSSETFLNRLHSSPIQPHKVHSFNSYSGHSQTPLKNCPSYNSVSLDLIRRIEHKANLRFSISSTKKRLQRSERQDMLPSAKLDYKQIINPRNQIIPLKLIKPRHRLLFPLDNAVRRVKDLLEGRSINRSGIII